MGTKLTQTAVAGLATKAKPYWIIDSVPGLRVYVSPKGTVTYQLRADKRMITLGWHPALTLADARRMATGGSPLPEKPKTKTIREWVEIYVAGDAAHLVSVKRRGAVLRDMLGPILDREPGELTRPFLIEACGQRLREGLRGTTVHQYRTIVTMFVHWLVDKGGLDRTPLTRLPTIPRERRIKFLDAAGTHRLERFLATYNDDVAMGAFAMLSLHAGLRPGECQSLERECIDLQAGTILLRAGLTKSRKARVVGISTTLKKHLVRALPLLQEKGPFRVHRLRDRFNAMKRAAGIIQPLTPHSLRHSFASNLVSRGTPPNVVQSLLGHSSLSTTSIYVHATNEQAVAAVKVLDQPIGSRLIF